MFEVEIAGMRLLYTGDYSRVPDRHLSAADTPDNPPHIGEIHTYGCHVCVGIFRTKHCLAVVSYGRLLQSEGAAEDS